MADTNRDGLDELTNSAMAASHIAKILQAAQAAGAAGAAAQTVKEFHRQAAVVIIVILLLPILLILSLPSVIFGSLITPSDTVLTDELEVAENVITIKNNIAGILQTSYEAVLEEIAQDSQGRYSTEIVDEVGGHVTFNALQILSMYCAHMGTEDYADISIENLTEAVRSHRDDYYSYTTETESRTELVDKVVNGTLIQVPETHEYTTYTVTYAGDAYFADTIWQLSEQEQAFAADYAYSLTLYLRQIEQQEGISILEQINDLTADSTVPVAEGDFGNPFNDPAWRQHITSRFGLRPDVGLPGKDTTNHNGLDIAYGYGTPILAVQSGTVITATVSPSYGNYVVIDHGGGICTLYAHCSRLLVSVGQLITHRFRLSGVPVYIIAPLKGHEFYRMCKSVGGTFIRLGPGSPDTINFMEIRKQDRRSQEILDGAALQRSVLAAQIQTLHVLFSLRLRDMTNEEAQILDEALIETYARKGITHDNDSLLDPHDPNRYREMPIPGDLYAVLKEKPRAHRLANAISVFVTGSASNFNRQTNVDLNNPYTVIDISDLTGDMLVVGTFIAFTFTFAKVKEDITKAKLLVVDEAWQIIGASSNSLAANYIFEAVKTIRGYGGAPLIATQDISDFFALEDGKYGRGILNNCKIKIILNLEEDEAQLVQKVLKLTDAEIDLITRFERGNALISTNSNHVTVAIRCSQMEQELITTDREELRLIVERELKKKSNQEEASL